MERIKYIRNIVGFILFIIIIIKIFGAVTYLFRGEGLYGDRVTVTGLKEERRDSLDMIYIGGSAAFVYWEPLKAYNDFGFTSYDLATNSLQAESILAYVKYAEKYQNPDLYVIGARAFQYYGDEGNETGLRISSDALDIGMNRFSLIKEYLSNRKMDVDDLALYWDIAKYHTNYDALSSPMAWELIDNSTFSINKGGQLINQWCYLETPQDYQTDARAELSSNAKNTLLKLLNYCKDNDLNVLFVVCPYFITEDDYKLYNTIEDIVSEYGYDFLNTNNCYEEMGINFSRDFYDVNHVNSLGAEKYTDFLGKYLCKNYGLSDHRDDEQYTDWNEKAFEFIKTMENDMSSVINIITEAEDVNTLNENIITTDEFGIWSNLISYDKRYTIVAVGDGDSFDMISSDNKKYLYNLGMSDLYGRENYINISSVGSAILLNSEEQYECTVPIGNEHFPVSCVVDNSKQKRSIKIDGMEYSLRDTEGVNIVVYDNNFRNMVDSVVIKGQEDGSISIIR